MPYPDNDGATLHMSNNSPRKRKRSSTELVPVSSQCFIVSENNISNFKKCINKVQKQSAIIKGKLDEEMRKITDALSSDDDDEDLIMMANI